MTLLAALDECLGALKNISIQAEIGLEDAELRQHTLELILLGKYVVPERHRAAWHGVKHNSASDRRAAALWKGNV